MHGEHLDEHLGVKPATHHRRRRVGFLLSQPLFRADRNTWLFVTAPRCDSYYNICVQLSLHTSLLLAREKEQGHWLEISQCPFRPVGICMEGLGKVREIRAIVSMKYNSIGFFSSALYITCICTRRQDYTQGLWNVGRDNRHGGTTLQMQHRACMQSPPEAAVLGWAYWKAVE